MTYAPPTLNDLRDYWTANGGTFLGIVGDTRHAVTGTSYHLGKDQLAATAYSRTTARVVRAQDTAPGPCNHVAQ